MPPSFNFIVSLPCSCIRVSIRHEKIKWFVEYLSGFEHVPYHVDHSRSVLDFLFQKDEIKGNYKI